MGSVLSERKLLAELGIHLFLANMLGAFQDELNLYLVMDELPGGDLRGHLTKNKRFNEEQTSNIYINIDYYLVPSRGSYLGQRKN